MRGRRLVAHGAALLGAALVGLVAGAQPPGVAPGGTSSQADLGFHDSPHRATLPDPPPCDVVIRPADAKEALGRLNDPGASVFCVEPGDYRSAGRITLTASGREGTRRWLRYHAGGAPEPAVRQSRRALFESIVLQGASWWVVQGLTLQPVGPDPFRHAFFLIWGGDHNVVDGNLLDASQQKNQGFQRAFLLQALGRDPATGNSIQANVIRSGNASRAGQDYCGVCISVGNEPGADNDDNRVVDNEIYDWGDGIALSAGGSKSCDYPGRPRGTIIDNNDVYVTPAKRARCSGGASDPTGECACAENGIDVKPAAGSEPSQWTRITNNRVWGFRPSATPSCGGSGSRGQAVTAGNACAGGVLVEGNLVLDSASGVVAAGSDWVIRDNLVQGVRSVSGGKGGLGVGLLVLRNVEGIRVQRNTFVDVDRAIVSYSEGVDVRCNVVVRAREEALSVPGDERAERNFVYESSGTRGDARNGVYASAAESKNEQLCFWRRRWTSPERVCIPLARPTPASPHAGCEVDGPGEQGAAPAAQEPATPKGSR